MSILSLFSVGIDKKINGYYLSSDFSLMGFIKDIKMIKIVGSNVSSLVLACKLLDSEINFSFIPSGPLGSSWAGLPTASGLLDFGQRYFELEFGQTNTTDLRDYNNAVSHQDFVGYVKSYIEEGFKLSEVKVEAFLRNEIIKCPKQTVDLKEFFSVLTDKEVEEIETDALNTKISEEYDFEALVNNDADISHLDLDEMLTVNHGSRFNELLIFPFTKKFGLDLAKIPANLRRKLWCPVFFNRTIIEASRGTFSFKPKRTHFGFLEHSNSAFVRGLIDKIKESNRFLREDLARKYFEDDFLNDLTSNTDDLVLGCSVQWLADKLSFKRDMEKFHLRVLWIQIENRFIKRHIDYLSILDDAIPFIRVSTSSACKEANSTIFCFETTNLKVTPETLIGQSKKMNILHNEAEYKFLREVTAKIEVPSFNNRLAYLEMIESIKAKFPDINLDLCGEIFGRNTLNDQVLNGLLKYENIKHEYI